MEGRQKHIGDREVEEGRKEIDGEAWTNLALPPVGWQRTVEHPAQTTTVWAWLNTVVILGICVSNWSKICFSSR